eukprot:gb/GECG01002059.1/.p1 GENE.gb/GECG01002059.1/~~gb/GECG01002059.1/.p1  ORF type:complete len:501 (+),score=42.85 gb/GECG01002059.1/:1-1503(+)
MMALRRRKSLSRLVERYVRGETWPRALIQFTRQRQGSTSADESYYPRWMLAASCLSFATTLGYAWCEQGGEETSWGSYQYQTDQHVISKTIQDIRSVVGEENIETDIESTEEYQKESWSYHSGVSPHCVVYPHTTEEVQRIVKLCNDARIPVIPYGGGTALEGHTVSRFKAVYLNFRERMQDILEFNEGDMDVRVQPGITWQELNQQLARHKQFFAVDPGPGATIGGMVNTGCSGTNAVRYGTMRQHVLNLTVVTSDGRVIKTAQRARKTSAGYDLTSLVVGSEGSLGIVTEATLRLQPVPAQTAVAVIPFSSIGDASKTVQQIVQQGIQVQCCEILDDWMMRAINCSSSFNYEETPTLFIKFAGHENQVNWDAAKTREIAVSNKGGHFSWSTDESEKESLWEARKICLWSAPVLRERYSKQGGDTPRYRQLPPEDVGNLDTQVWITDVCVPISCLPQAIEDTKRDLDNSRLLGTSHLTIPNVANYGVFQIQAYMLQLLS